MRRAFEELLRFLASVRPDATSRATPAHAQESKDAFTLRLAERFRAAMPGKTVEITEPLQIQVGDGPSEFINVGRVFKYCRHSSAEECEDSLANFIAVVADIAKHDDGPVTREQLRVVVRSSDYCDYLESLFDEGKPKPLIRDFLPRIRVRLVRALPGQSGSIDADDLAELGLKSDAAWALALRQTLEPFPEPKSLKGLDETVLLVCGYLYMASLILDAEGWRAAAAEHGELIGAVPADDTMLVVRAANVGDLDRLKAAVRDHFDTAERGISPYLYRWTDEGWAALPDQD